jgi:serine phosphatase RsbU (regulator of sigma subunit)
MLRRNGSIRDYGATGRPIGLLSDQSYESEQAELAEGDTVLLYTDGLLEAGGLSGSDEFGLDRIRTCLSVDGSPRIVIERLTAALAAHIDGDEPEDDVTLVCIQRKVTDR